MIIALVFGTMLAMPAWLWLGLWWDHRANCGGLTKCCNATKDGYYTPFGWNVWCTKCGKFV